MCLTEEIKEAKVKEALKELGKPLFVDYGTQRVAVSVCYRCNLVKIIYKIKSLRDKTVSICKDCYEVEVCV